jgi:hypothetical protein
MKYILLTTLGLILANPQTPAEVTSNITAPDAKWVLWDDQPTKEWMDDRDDPNNKHRHVSHLWAVHPETDSSSISRGKTASPHH